MYTNNIKYKYMLKIVLLIIAFWLISVPIHATFSSGVDTTYNSYISQFQFHDDFEMLEENGAEEWEGWESWDGWENWDGREVWENWEGWQEWEESINESWEEWEESINSEESTAEIAEEDREEEVVNIELHTPAFTQIPMAGNNYPIVFVNSFLFSWGADELGPLHPWGAFSSIPDFLATQGFRVLEPIIGPFSSNRHRAIELYYYLKGGTVDYGAYQAFTYGHARFGRTFPGIFPEWDHETRVHLIGFSMGGLTAREIANLIADGCEREIAFHQQNPHLEISPLLAGETTGGIHSITTIGTPNNGMSFVSERNIFLPFAQRMVRFAASLSGVTINRFIFDFRFDQFGLRRNPGETFAAYANRVFSSPIWRTQNTAIRDLRVNGVTANATNLQTRPDIYYFSHTGQTTRNNGRPRRNGRTGERPMLSTDLILIPSTLFTIVHRDPLTNPPIDNRWAASDGMVSTISSIHPFGHPARPYDGNPVRGVWNHHPVMHRWDHSSLHGYGFSRTTDEVNQFYLNIAWSLQSLPVYTPNFE